MVSRIELKNFSPEQLAEAKKLSSAVDRYLPLLDLNAKDFSQKLRQKRHRAWIECVLATIFKTHSCEHVCAYWSQATLELLTEAWKHHGLEGSPLSLLAMGKLAANELNLSSDIDIIFVSRSEPEKELLKKVRAFLHSLTEVSVFGFGYRVDLDLRPGGSSAPLILSFDQMTNHYGYQGETWERVALVRMFPALGDAELGKDISDFCRKFAFRRHIDYTLLNDLFGMRERIQNAQPLTYKKNLKFSKGGIRDLELFIHSLLLIHGGKKPSLITRSTTQAVENLQGGQVLNAKDAQFLKDTYWFYRSVENRIHAADDQHTYDLPLQPTPLVSAEDLRAFSEKSAEVSLLVDQFLAPHAKKATAPISEEALEHSFQSMGLDAPETTDAWEKMLKASARSKEKIRDENERRRFLSSALEHIHDHGIDKNLAILSLSRFLSSIKAKTSFFSLFNQHRELIAELSWIFSCSPYLSQILIHRPEIIDSFLTKTFDLDRADDSTFYNSLKDYKLLSDLASSSAFLRNRNLDLLTKNLSDTTDTVITELLADLSQKNKKPLDILTLGKWAGREMGLKSDLDFVFITPDVPEDVHFKMARRFISFLQSPGTGQTLYQIDLRLRPTGHAGPLLMTLHDLKTYLDERGKAWERQAYLNNRLLSLQRPQPLFPARPLSSDDLKELTEIQKRLLEVPKNSVDLKKTVGGLIHTEFTLQILLLSHQLFPQEPGMAGFLTALAPFIDTELADKIRANYIQLRTYEQLLILLSDSPNQALSEDDLSFRKLAVLIKSPVQDLFENVRETLRAQADLLKELDALGGALKIEE